MPKTTIKAASVTMLSGMPKRYIRPTEMNVLTGMVTAATKADRKGKRIIITTMITTMASARLIKKSFTDSPTTLAWSAMRLTVTSVGR